MQKAKMIAAGFVAGIVVAGGAAFLLRDNAARTREEERIAALDSQIQSLERAVSKLSGVVTAGAPDAAVPTTVSRNDALPPTPAASRDPTARDADQAQHAIAEADAMVDRGLQSGQWTREQAAELSEATADLSVQEQGRILARVSAAINVGQLQVELP
ncbi:MAG TPA: hypothetical protein VGO61_20990 [Steroidobacteraceae bacterium]|jgi:hypothetical protein|nr:hypothetical protein [Steroidobacteraceae bacterium]